MTAMATALYQRLAPVYDVVFGAPLQPGRRRALFRLAPRGGESILEIGVGTGIDLSEYPADCRVTAVDLSARMIGQAAARVRRHNLGRVFLCRMDAGNLAFPSAHFDAIYAPYVINVVSDPIRAGREMLRVCRSGGRIVLLNHFEGVNAPSPGFTRLVGRVATTLTGVNWKLDLGEFLHATALTLHGTDDVNLGGVSTVVTCRKE